MSLSDEKLKAPLQLIATFLFTPHHNNFMRHSKRIAHSGIRECNFNNVFFINFLAEHAASWMGLGLDSAPTPAPGRVFSSLKARDVRYLGRCRISASMSTKQKRYIVDIVRIL